MLIHYVLVIFDEHNIKNSFFFVSDNVGFIKTRPLEYNYI